MQVVNLKMGVAFRVIEFRALEGRWVARVGEPRLHFGSSQAWELRQKFGAALTNLRGEFRHVVGEIKERTAGREFLTLKQHGSTGRKQRQRRERAQFSGRCQRMTPLAIGGIGYLIVILEERDHGRGVDVERRRASAFFLPLVALTL